MKIWRRVEIVSVLIIRTAIYLGSFRMILQENVFTFNKYLLSTFYASGIFLGALACFGEETWQKMPPSWRLYFSGTDGSGWHGDGNYLSIVDLIIRLWLKWCFLITSLENLHTVKRGSEKYWNLLRIMRLWLLYLSRL